MSLGSYVDDWDGKRRHIVATFVHTYSISFAVTENGNPLSWENINRDRVSSILRATRTIGGKVYDLKVTHSTALDYKHVILCSTCKSRPVTWEWDCDGLFPNVSCDSEQCPANEPYDVEATEEINA